MNRDPRTGPGPGPLPRGAPVSDAMIRSPKLLGPETTIARVRAFFGDDHVHAALIVDGGRLLAVVEPLDLIGSLPTDGPAARAGHLSGRITRPDADLAATWETMAALDRRRLAVVDSHGILLGLLCLKRTGLGFCSEANVRARAEGRSTVG